MKGLRVATKVKKALSGFWQKALVYFSVCFFFVYLFYSVFCYFVVQSDRFRILTQAITLTPEVLGEFLPTLLQFIILPIIGLLADCFLALPLAKLTCGIYRGNAPDYVRFTNALSSGAEGLGICLLRLGRFLLFSLLLIVPGILVAIEDSLVVYVKADRPDLTTKECFAESRRLIQKLRGTYTLWFLLFLALGLVFLAAVVLLLLYAGLVGIIIAACLSVVYCIGVRMLRTFVGYALYLTGKER